MGIFRQRRPVPHLVVFLSSLLICSLLLAAMPAGVAFAGDCDGTAADDTVTCAVDPTVPDDIVGLGLGNDVYVQNDGVTSQIVDGDGLEDGTESVAVGGNDHITINGHVLLCVDGDNVDGDGGNDTIIINGTVDCSVDGDYVSGSGGNDRITVNGTVASDVIGDYSDVDGGDDIIIVNGSVGGDVVGDDALANGGNDAIYINGNVDGSVYGDDVFGAGGNDTVVLGSHATIGGILDGEDGYDVLQFHALTQSQLAGLDPAGGTISFGGHTYVCKTSSS